LLLLLSYTNDKVYIVVKLLYPMANKEVYPRDMSFIDRQERKVVPSRTDFLRRKCGNAGETDVGEAYAFFDCAVSKGGIEKSLPYIKRDAQTPEGLELVLSEGSAELQLDPKLRELLAYPDDYRINVEHENRGSIEPEARALSGLKYSLRARFPGHTNEDAAEELVHIMNLALPMNHEQGYLRGAVVYKARDGVYSLA